MAVRLDDSNIATTSDDCNTGIGEGREKADRRKRIGPCEIVSPG